MQYIIVLIFGLMMSISLYAQPSHYDSIKALMQQDSIDYENQLKDADRIKHQADSIIETDLGHVPSITPISDSISLSIKVQALLLQRQQEAAAERRQYYLFGGAVIFILAVVVIAAKKGRRTDEADS
ncbi:hypothetical protein BH11BAC6_BH11BAC6_09710 [soil metagenome]